MKDVIVGRHFDVMKEGALVCNTGHYDCEINLVELEARAKSKREIRFANEEYVLKNGVRVYILAQGRLVNLAAAEGHPSEVMDMSFANQYLALCKLARDGKTMKPAVYELSPEQDQELALIKLGTQGISIDKLTPEQVKYQDDYSSGT
jgi:adenosylhomocysteinase